MVVGVDGLGLATTECLTRSEMELKLNWKYLNSFATSGLYYSTYMHSEHSETVSPLVPALGDIPPDCTTAYTISLRHLLLSAMAMNIFFQCHDPSSHPIKQIPSKGQDHYQTLFVILPIFCDPVACQCNVAPKNAAQSENGKDNNEPEPTGPEDARPKFSAKSLYSSEQVLQTAMRLCKKDAPRS